MTQHYISARGLPANRESELRDAKLVAAAPELLRALKDILDMIGPLSDVAMIRRKNSALDAIRLATEESES